MQDLSWAKGPLGVALRVVWLGQLLWLLSSTTVIFGAAVGALTVSWSLHVALSVVPALVLQLRHRRWVPAGLGGLAMVLGLFPWGLSLGEPRAAPLPSTGPRLRVMVANTFYSPPRLDALTQDIEATGAGLVALLEPPNALPAHLEGTGRWQILGAHTPGGKWNIALLLRRDLLGPEGQVVLHSSGPLVRDYTDSVTIEAHLGLQGRDLYVSAMHAPAPTDLSQQRQRLRLLPAVAQELRRPGVVLADFNATVASPLWRAIVQQGLRRPEGGSPATWPSWFGPLAVALDHALVSEGLCAGEAAPVWLTGSDHRGVVVDLAWAP